jgi:hypothetical protein
MYLDFSSTFGKSIGRKDGLRKEEIISFKYKEKQ